MAELTERMVEKREKVPARRPYGSRSSYSYRQWLRRKVEKLAETDPERAAQFDALRRRRATAVTAGNLRRAIRRGTLTPREEEILSLIAKGLPPEGIQEELGLAPQTVANATNIIYAKIKVPGHKRVNATLWALRNGLVELEVGGEWEEWKGVANGQPNP